MDTSTITACSNDYSFNKLFSRNLEALGLKNDILIVKHFRKFKKYFRGIKNSKRKNI